MVKQSPSRSSPSHSSTPAMGGIAGRAISVGLLSPSMAFMARINSRVYTVFPLELGWKLVS